MPSSGAPKRSVQFSEAADATSGPPAKRRRPTSEDGPAATATEADPRASGTGGKKDKAPSRYRPNEDELDDVDEWDEAEDGDGDGGGWDGTAVPSEARLIEAKRQRRLQRGGGARLFAANDDGGGNDSGNDDVDDGDGRHGPSERSLAADGIKIEPFHMRDEETDGTGYFDGDTYVFRRNPAEDDGEPDAWADSLHDEDGNPTSDLARRAASDVPTSPNGNPDDDGDDDDLTVEQLYRRILPLVSDTETVARAIRRYGQLVGHQNHLRRKGGKRRGPATQQPDAGDAPDPSTTAAAASNSSKSNNSEAMAKSCLDVLTGAASALLLRGEVDIYDTTRRDVLRRFPPPPVGGGADGDGLTAAAFAAGTPEEEAAAAMAAGSPATNACRWEYTGNQDDSVHGPFTTEQMLGWVQAGYFVGDQRVRIRTVREGAGRQEGQKNHLSTQDDLLADLMDDEEDEDDDDDDDDESRPSKRAKQAPVKGDWMWSNEVDYKKYL